MKLNMRRILIALCVLVAVIVIGVVFYSSRTVTENFEEKQESKEESKEEKEASLTDKQPHNSNNLLSKKEQEIFNDLLNNRLTDVNIDSLINSGVLTENMIEKFLTKMKNPNAKSADKDESFVVEPPLELNSNVPVNARIEAFTGFTSLTPMYATASTANIATSTPTTNKMYSQY